MSDSKNALSGLPGYWWALGIGVGVAIGVALDDIAVGVGVGAAVAVAFLVSDRIKSKKSEEESQ